MELHYVAVEVREFGYFGKLEFVQDKANLVDQVATEISERAKTIRSLEATLSNESVGAEVFNSKLAKFLGRQEIALRFNPAIYGYEITRNGSQQHDGNLSEGEKTAIAIVYFLTKLEEKDNKIANTIVVIDDPVSSFDSNYLFHAYSFIRNHCRESKQLFILTHNFTFFKMMRDWFAGSNANRKSRKNPQPPNAFFFTIENTTSNPRSAFLQNAHRSLTDYNSEYHYIFSKLHSYHNLDVLNREDAFLTANLCRKLLETFFCFKYPKYRSDLARLLDAGLAGCERTDELIKERIYRFINRYSHCNGIETNEDSAENLAGEGNNVIADIFRWIEEVDSVHYVEMLEVSN